LWINPLKQVAKVKKRPVAWMLDSNDSRYRIEVKTAAKWISLRIARLRRHWQADGILPR
jgi:hypothetical protein